jgi:hypothetical protein
MAVIDKINNINKFFDKKTGKIIRKYDPNNPNLALSIRLADKSNLIVDASEIRIQYGGQITFDYEGQKHIVDDGYRDVLIKAGYIVLNNYDCIRNDDKEAGIEIREQLMKDALAALNNITSPYDTITTSTTCIKATCSTDPYNYTLSIDTINSIVTKNQERSKNNLPFYPFDKNMDKYGTLYLSFFAEKNENIIENQGNKKFQFADEHINSFILCINSICKDIGNVYKFKPLQIDKRVLNWEGL